MYLVFVYLEGGIVNVSLGVAQGFIGIGVFNWLFKFVIVVLQAGFFVVVFVIRQEEDECIV